MGEVRCSHVRRFDKRFTLQLVQSFVDVKGSNILLMSKAAKAHWWVTEEKWIVVSFNKSV